MASRALCFSISTRIFCTSPKLSGRKPERWQWEPSINNTCANCLCGLRISGSEASGAAFEPHERQIAGVKALLINGLREANSRHGTSSLLKSNETLIRFYRLWQRNCTHTVRIVTITVRRETVTTLSARSFRRRFFSYHQAVKHPHTSTILSWLSIPLVLKCAAKILTIG